MSFRNDGPFLCPQTGSVARGGVRAAHVTRLSRCSRALTYLEPEKPTVGACGMRSVDLVTYRPVAPRSSSSAEAMMARKMRSMGVHRGWL